MEKMSQLEVENKTQLGQLLLKHGIVTAEQIELALEEQVEKGHNKLLGELLVEMNYCTENQIASTLAEGYEVDGDELTIRCGDQVLIFKGD